MTAPRTALLLSFIQQHIGIAEVIDCALLVLQGRRAASQVSQNDDSLLDFLLKSFREKNDRWQQNNLDGSLLTLSVAPTSGCLLHTPNLLAPSVCPHQKYGGRGRSGGGGGAAATADEFDV